MLDPQVFRGWRKTLPVPISTRKFVSFQTEVCHTYDGLVETCPRDAALAYLVTIYVLDSFPK
jgi:hypothetical protein